MTPPKKKTRRGKRWVKDWDEAAKRKQAEEPEPCADCYDDGQPLYGNPVARFAGWLRR